MLKDAEKDDSLIEELETSQAANFILQQSSGSSASAECCPSGLLRPRVFQGKRACSSEVWGVTSGCSHPCKSGHNTTSRMLLRGESVFLVPCWASCCQLPNHYHPLDPIQTMSVSVALPHCRSATKCRFAAGGFPVPIPILAAGGFMWNMSSAALFGVPMRNLLGGRRAFILLARIPIQSHIIPS